MNFDECKHKYTKLPVHTSINKLVYNTMKFLSRNIFINFIYIISYNYSEELFIVLGFI